MPADDPHQRIVLFVRHKIGDTVWLIGGERVGVIVGIVVGPGEGNVKYSVSWSTGNTDWHYDIEVTSDHGEAIAHKAVEKTDG